MAPASQASLQLRGGEMHALRRAAILSRYRRYRDLRMDLQTAALESVPRSSLLAHAKRIGLSDGKVLFTDDIVELSLAFVLAASIYELAIEIGLMSFIAYRECALPDSGPMTLI